MKNTKNIKIYYHIYQNLMLDDTEIEKDKFYSYKSAFVEDVHTKKVSISNKISFGENN